MADNTPLKRYGQPEEVARLMLFLGSEDGSFVLEGSTCVTVEFLVAGVFSVGYNDS